MVKSSDARKETCFTTLAVSHHIIKIQVKDVYTIHFYTVNPSTHLRILLQLIHVCYSPGWHTTYQFNLSIGRCICTYFYCVFSVYWPLKALYNTCHIHRSTYTFTYWWQRLPWKVQTAHQEQFGVCSSLLRHAAGGATRQLIYLLSYRRLLPCTDMCFCLLPLEPWWSQGVNDMPFKCQ